MQHFKCPVCHKQHANIGQLVYHAKKTHELELDKVRAREQLVACGALISCELCCRVAVSSLPHKSLLHCRCPTHCLATTAWL